MCIINSLNFCKTILSSSFRKRFTASSCTLNIVSSLRSSMAVSKAWIKSVSSRKKRPPVSGENIAFTRIFIEIYYVLDRRLFLLITNSYSSMYVWTGRVRQNYNRDYCNDEKLHINMFISATPAKYFKDLYVFINKKFPQLYKNIFFHQKKNELVVFKIEGRLPSFGLSVSAKFIKVQVFLFRFKK